MHTTIVADIVVVAHHIHDITAVSGLKCRGNDLQHIHLIPDKVDHGVMMSIQLRLERFFSYKIMATRRLDIRSFNSFFVAFSSMMSLNRPK
ncbi:hypothetical protein DSY3556 [Desulfitobacterium hafniense Y51]|uniref:Uncharacterized protein n=1 Tax=Desulfitobacterium hafniense (strain Y51) TaxID=138119 RepID=Q24RJ7_DESHY|nr:hypothetical protein DSY3556 [Desulfitobacterium hafniense Y51]